MFTFFVREANAAPIDIGESFGPATPFSSIGAFLNVLLPNVLTIAGIITLIITVVAGLGIISNAGGDPEKLNKSKAAFTSAVIGLIIIFGAYFIIQILETLLGFKLLSPLTK